MADDATAMLNELGVVIEPACLHLAEELPKNTLANSHLRLCARPTPSKSLGLQKAPLAYGGPERSGCLWSIRLRWRALELLGALFFPVARIEY